MEDGLLAITNDDCWIGRGGDGGLTISGGTMRTRSLRIGASDDGTNAPSGFFTLTGGNALVSSNFVVGTSGVSTGQVFMVGGKLIVTNIAHTAVFRLDAGDFSVLQGELVADQLILTNTTSTFTFNSGTIRARSITASNGTPFVVGDGVNPATLQLTGGTFTFPNGLYISSSATVTGCGTVIGSIVNNGTYTNYCPPASVLAITTLTKTGTTAAVTFNSVSSLNHTLEFKQTLADANWIPIPPTVPGTGSAMTLNDPAATNVTRFYRIRAQ